PGLILFIRNPRENPRRKFLKIHFQKFLTQLPGYVFSFFRINIMTPLKKRKIKFSLFRKPPAWSLITVLIVEKPAMERKFSTLLLILTCSLWIVPGILMLLII